MHPRLSDYNLVLVLSILYFCDKSVLNGVATNHKGFPRTEYLGVEISGSFHFRFVHAFLGNFLYIVSSS